MKPNTIENKKTPLGGLIALVLLAAFFLPYIFKLPQLDITLILVGGLALAIYDIVAGEKH
ncbi:MAG: hypothetical protein ACO3QP_02460 [Burkholderiaceae bacterium]|jgi:hypothetical protein